jgi:FdrA protein
MEPETGNSIDGILALLRTDAAVINLGLPLFAETLSGEGVRVLHVDWRPPADGDEELARMLAALQGREG